MTERKKIAVIGSGSGLALIVAARTLAAAAGNAVKSTKEFNKVLDKLEDENKKQQRHEG